MHRSLSLTYFRIGVKLLSRLSTITRCTKESQGPMPKIEREVGHFVLGGWRISIFIGYMRPCNNCSFDLKYPATPFWPELRGRVYRNRKRLKDPYHETEQQVGHFGSKPPFLLWWQTDWTVWYILLLFLPVVPLNSTSSTPRPKGDLFFFFFTYFNTRLCLKWKKKNSWNGAS